MKYRWQVIAKLDYKTICSEVFETMDTAELYATYLANSTEEDGKSLASGVRIIPVLEEGEF